MGTWSAPGAPEATDPVGIPNDYTNVTPAWSTTANNGSQIGWWDLNARIVGYVQTDVTLNNSNTGNPCDYRLEFQLQNGTNVIGPRYSVGNGANHRKAVIREVPGGAVSQVGVRVYDADGYAADWTVNEVGIFGDTGHNHTLP